MHRLSIADAELFFEAYKGVWEDYSVSGLVLMKFLFKILQMNQQIDLIFPSGTHQTFYLRPADSNRRSYRRQQLPRLCRSIWSGNIEAVALFWFGFFFFCLAVSKLLFVANEQEIARKLQPSSLRAIFGRDLAQNAVYCTDLPNDGLREVSFHFVSIFNFTYRFT